MINLKLQMTNSKNVMPFISYIVLLFFVDMSKVLDLYEQNIVRRAINMYRRTDYLAYKDKLDPFCKHVKQILDNNDLQKIQQIKIPNTLDVSWFSRKNTTTHQCCESFTKKEKQIIDELSAKIKDRYEKEIGKKLHYFKENNATIYVYHGKNSHHLWHVDPRNVSYIYNVIVCFKKVGDISPLQCKDKDGNINSINFDPGDAGIFKGGTTIHQVPPNNDENSKRYVLSLSFTSNIKLAESKLNSNNLCTYIKGGNNYIGILKTLLCMLILNLILSYCSKINTVSYKFMIILTVLTLFMVKYVPKIPHFKLGTGRSSSISKNLVIISFIIISTISVKGGIAFSLYFLLSDVFFPRTWVEYD